MSKAQNEIEEFIYKICYHPIWESVNNYIAAHPTTLNLSMSRIKYRDTAMLLDMLLEYATIKHILQDEKFIAYRCPAEMSCPYDNEEWTDEQRMEWQTNNLAPRILMPIQTFKIKVDELYKRYDYENNPLKIPVTDLHC